MSLCYAAMANLEKPILFSLYIPNNYEYITAKLRSILFLLLDYKVHLRKLQCIYMPSSLWSIGNQLVLKFCYCRCWLFFFFFFFFLLFIYFTSFREQDKADINFTMSAPVGLESAYATCDLPVLPLCYRRRFDAIVEKSERWKYLKISTTILICLSAWHHNPDFASSSNTSTLKG